VYDVTTWAPIPSDVVNHHPGGSQSIRKWQQTFLLTFPAQKYSWHTMDRWQEYSVKEDRFGKFVGRYGDRIKFDDLPVELQIKNVGYFFGAKNYLANVIGNTGGTLVCGSQGEVAPDPTQDDHFEIQLYDVDTLDSMKPLASPRQTIWTHHALYSSDQLRQRMAWALSQILAVTPDELTGSGYVCISLVLLFSNSISRI
jgi:hypothetical protein